MGLPFYVELPPDYEIVVENLSGVGVLLKLSILVEHYHI